MNEPQRISYRGYVVVLNTDVPEEFRFPNETAVKVFELVCDCEISKRKFTWSDVERMKSDAGLATTREAMKACFTVVIDRWIEERVYPEKTTYKGYSVTTYRTTPEAARKPSGEAIRIQMGDGHYAHWSRQITWADVERCRRKHRLGSTDEAITKYFTQWIDDTRALNRPRPHTLIEWAVPLIYPLAWLNNVPTRSTLLSLNVALFAAWLVALLCNKPAFWRMTLKGALRGTLFLFIVFTFCPDAEGSSWGPNSHFKALLFVSLTITVSAEVVYAIATSGCRFPRY
jgi:hypothetical protein